MLIFSISLLLLICLVNGSCPDQPEIQQCMSCSTTTRNCDVSSDNQLVNCTLPSDCDPKPCSSPWHVCMTFWARDNPSSPWTVLSSCISAGATESPCDFSEMCIDPKEVNTVDTGTFTCRCYGPLCNRHFLAGVIPPVVGSGSTSGIPEPLSTAAVMSTVIPVTTNIPPIATVIPTPTVIFDERDCITDCSAPPNCTFSADNRSMKCVVDDSCLTNVTRCDARTSQTCLASWHRDSPASPWIYSGNCIGGSSNDLPPPFCRVTRSPFVILPSDSVETGSFFCTCFGARCNREFEIDLDDFVTSTSTATTTASTAIMPVTTVATVPISAIVTTLFEVTPSVDPDPVGDDENGKCVGCRKSNR